MLPANRLGFLAWVALAGSLSAADTVASLTLEQALASVERLSLTVLLSRETAAQAIEAVGQQRSGILPNLTLSAQQRRSQGVSIATVVVSSGRPANRFDALVTGNYALLKPDSMVAVDAAKVGVQVAEANYAAAVQGVLADVATSYFTHLRNLRRLDVLDANIARARSLLELARNQLAAGVATQIDVTRAEAQLSQAEQARLQQVTSVYQSELVLKRLLDIETSRELRLENFQVRRANPALYTFSEEKSAFERRAEYLAAQRSVDQARLNVRSAGYERLPSLSLSGTFGYAAPKFDDEKQDQWSFGVGMSVPIFDGLRTSANRRIALSRQRAQEARLHHLELQISAELRLAIQDASSRNAQVSVAEKSLRLAQEELRLAQQRYQQGVADNREVVEAQNRLAVADDNLVEAIYQYHVSRVVLARAKGEVRAVLAERNP
ncbi:MAG: TolC family protein [Verrucomicrobia bacterium]|nr:TolC family protein [Verrucomicrobiota bacterium]